MKKTILFAITAFAIIATCLISCKKQSDLSTPSNFKAYQEGNTIVLSWNEVSGASYYEINKNGSYWQSTSDTRIVDKSPKEGINSYELIASNGDKQSKPVKTACEFESSGSGGGGGEQTSTDFYIKHPWGTGEDADWSWKPMTKSGNSYTYTGLWGGVGANINTTADDSGAEWYEASSISGASSCSIGDNVTFIFISSNGAKGSLSVSSNGGGGNPGGGGTTTSKPNTPTGVKATAGSSSISVTWNSVSGAESYNIYRSTSASGSYSYQTNVYSTSYTDYNVNAGTTYYYKVSAENSAGESSKSSYASAKIASSGGGDNPGGGGGGGTVTKPSAPTGVKATQQGDDIVVTWNAVSNVMKYYIYRSESSYGTYSLINESYTNSYTDNYALISGKTYYYKVSAVNAGGEGSQSSSAYCKYERQYAPCAPQGVSVTQTYSGSVKIKWDVSTATGCGKPTKQVILLWNTSSYKWEEKTPSTSNSGGSYEILSSYLNNYVDILSQLVFIIKLENAKGTEEWEFTYNYETDQITHYEEK